MPYLRAVLSLLVVSALALHARSAAACSVCLAGDPSFSTHGTSSQEAGSVAVYLEVREFSKQSGRNEPVHEEAEHDHEAIDGEADPEATAEPAPAEDGGHAHEHAGREAHDTQRLDLYVAWTPLDRVTLTLDVPWTANDIAEVAPEETTHFALAGLGDVSLAVSGVVWRNRPALPSTWVELRAFGKAPTGRDEQRVDGEVDAHLQTGTGSWDFGFGAAAVHRLEWGALYASSFYRVNTEGALDYEYGDVVLATLGLEAPLGHMVGRPALDRVTPGLALDFRWADRDRQHGDVEDTGGSILYVTPSLRIALPAFSETQRAWLRTGVQIPVTDAWLYDRQDESPVWSVGIGYGF